MTWVHVLLIDSAFRGPTRTIAFLADHLNMSICSCLMSNAIQEQAHSTDKRFFQAPFLVLRFITNLGDLRQYLEGSISTWKDHDKNTGSPEG